LPGCGVSKARSTWLNDFSGAEVALVKAVDLDGNFEAARLLLAAYYVAAHKHDEALHQLIRPKAIAPPH
jgi:hypothetical protein